MLTHFIPNETDAKGVARKVYRAVCGLYISDRDHDADPMCPICARWCEQNTADAKALAAKWEQEHADAVR